MVRNSFRLIHLYPTQFHFAASCPIVVFTEIAPAVHYSRVKYWG